MIGLSVCRFVSLSVGVAKSGTLQMPFLRMFCQSSPSLSLPLTPILSMMRPFSSGKDGSTGGHLSLRLRGGVFVSVGVGDGVGEAEGDKVTGVTVSRIVVARTSEVVGERR